jgi:hypothetical protein
LVTSIVSICSSVTPCPRRYRRTRASLERRVQVGLEAVHPENEPRVGELGRMLDVRDVPAVTQDT